MKINIRQRGSQWIKSRLLFLLIVFLVFLCFSACLHAAEKKSDIFHNLRLKLEQDGFDRETISRYYSHPKVVFETKAVGRYFQHRESSLNYNQFLTPVSLRKAENYMQKNRYWLEKAESEYGVDKEIITAILLVETRLGTFTGNASTLNILSSMAALSDPDIREMLWRSQVDKTDMSRADFQKKAVRKAEWAYNELTAFLKYVDREHIVDPVDISGSYAGAVGISQFMPSNILTLAVDGDKNGKVDLFTHADAIFSVASYLQHHGWKSGLSPEAARKVLFSYNHSTYYVDVLMKLSQMLEKAQ